MTITAGQVFKDLEAGKWKPFYLVAGEEPFQAAEILTRLKAFFVRGETSDAFNHESWDGEHLDGGALHASLDMLPGLFDGPDTMRLVTCTRFDKASASALEALEPYFKNPSPTTCFVMFCAKTDKRKGWYKHVDELGCIIEIDEPNDREWPKWHQFFERKLKKRIDAPAWEMTVDSAGRALSVVWAELLKSATYVGDASAISREDVLALNNPVGTDDVFAFVEDVMSRRAYQAMQRYGNLIRSGESDIKLLSLLVRQFRLVDSTQRLVRKGVTDSKALASQIGTYPFLVSKLKGQAQSHSPKALDETLTRLTECDYQMKTGAGTLFELFLVPYFAGSAKRA